MKRTILISGLTATLLMGCSEMKKMDDMKNNTSQMKETTTKMNDKMAHMDSTTTGMDKKMAQMNDTTTHMDETTTGMSEKMTAVVTKTEGVKAISEELYDTIRQGNSVTLRRDGYAAVLNAPTLFKKISEANKYFMSFEFQIWNSHGQDLEPNQRDILGQQAAQEFFTEIEGLAERDNSVNPLANPDPVEILVDPSCAENREASFNAFAMALHQVNRKEVRAETQNSGLKRMTMYSMMEDALLAPRNMPQAGYIREILAHEEKAIQILQTRYNIFPLVFIDAVSKLTDKNVFKKAIMTYWSWEFDIDKLNASQVDYLQTEVLQYAVASKQLLVRIGQKPALNGTVARLLKNMKIVYGGTKAKKTEQFVSSQKKLVDLLQYLQKN